MRVASGRAPQSRNLSFIVLPQQIERLIGPAVERIFFHQRLQTRDRRRIGLAQVVETSNLKFALAQHFLHFQQTLLRLRHQLAVRILQNHLSIFVLGALGVRVIAIRLLHLLIMNVGDLQLRLRRFRHVGEEYLEVTVLLLRLRQSRGSTLRIPRVAHRQLGARDELRIRISVDQGLQRQPRHVEAIVPHGVHGLVEQNFVRLLRPEIGQRVYRLLVGAANGDHQQHAQHKTQRNST